MGVNDKGRYVQDRLRKEEIRFPADRITISKPKGRAQGFAPLAQTRQSALYFKPPRKGGALALPTPQKRKVAPFMGGVFGAKRPIGRGKR